MDARLLNAGAPPGRYDGRPFLRLLECYVLWVIGELAASHAALLEEMTPQLQATYGFAHDWPQIIETSMAFSDEVPAGLRSMWERNSAAGATAGQGIDPESWARHVVDTNFI